MKELVQRFVRCERTGIETRFGCAFRRTLFFFFFFVTSFMACDLLRSWQCIHSPFPRHYGSSGTDVGRTSGPPVAEDEEDAASEASVWEARDQEERAWERREEEEFLGRE